MTQRPLKYYELTYDSYAEHDASVLHRRHMFFPDIYTANASSVWLKNHITCQRFTLAKITLTRPNRTIICDILNGRVGRHVTSEETLQLWERTNAAKDTTSSDESQENLRPSPASTSTEDSKQEPEQTRPT